MISSYYVKGKIKLKDYLKQCSLSNSYIYKLIESNQTAYAAAGSLILFGIILIVTIINNYVSKKTVHY